MCQKLKADAKSLGQQQNAYKHIVVDEKHKIMLCVPYKSGATTHLQLLAQNSDAALMHKMPEAEMQRILRSLYLKKNRERFGIKDFSSFSPQRQQQLLEEFYKVTVVRHPLVRLLSLYRNRVANFNTNTRLWDCNLKAAGRGLSSWLRVKHPRAARNCTFGAFVEFLTQHRENFVRDQHLVPMHNWCRPCDIKYDFMVRLESGDSDQRYLIQNYINPNFNGTLHGNAALHSKTDSSDKFEDFWPQFSDITDQQLAFLSNVYEYDLKLFGFEYERRSGGLGTTCRVSTGSGSCC